MTSRQQGEQQRVREEAARAAERATAAASAARRAAGAGSRAVAEAVAEAAQRSESLQSVVATALEAAEAAAERTRELVERLPGPEVVEGVLEEAGARIGTAVERSGDAWDALRGRKRRRWPWATGAAVAGAAAGVGAALLVRALRHEDPPGAQDPSQVQAVIDTTGVSTTPVDKAAPVPAAQVDEDGEAVQP